MMDTIRLQNIKDELVAITHGCRSDMHEADEQGLKAFVIGNHLDNALGNAVTVERGYQEYLVVMTRDDMRFPVFINLADLIALARMADVG